MNISCDKHHKDVIHSHEICITSEFDTIIITFFTASVWVCFDPKIILDPECHKKRNTNVYVGPGMQIPTQTSLNPSAGQEKLSDFAFPRIAHFGSSTLLPTVKACSLWWQCPKDCLDPKVLTSPPNKAPPLFSPSSRCCCSASPRGCSSTAP